MKTSIEIMAKYCAKWQRWDIFKSYADQVRNPFATVEKNYHFTAMWDLCEFPKEGYKFWDAVSSAIVHNDPKFLPNQNPNENVSTIALNLDEAFGNALGIITKPKAPRTLRDLKVGDVVEDKVGDKRRVLGVCGEIVFLSYFHSDDFLNRHKIAGRFCSLFELERDEYKLA